MCGRFLATSPPSVLADYLGVDEVRTDGLGPSWNVAPTDAVYAVSQRTDGRRLLGTYRWGLVPHWSKGPGATRGMINARAETLGTRFGPAFRRRRCLLPADGFYEWERRGKATKQPWAIRRADGAPMVFAGLWEVWRDPDAPEDAEPLRSCCIVTTAANELLVRIHDRMPVVLGPGDWDEWVDRDNSDRASLSDLLVPADARLFEMFEVSTLVNSVRNNSADLIDPV